jgi:hypothetical protein
LGLCVSKLCVSICIRAWMYNRYKVMNLGKGGEIRDRACLAGKALCGKFW